MKKSQHLTSNTFIDIALDKFKTLIPILKYFNSGELEGKFAIRGGTGLALTILKLSRLSVDIDLDFCINLPKDELNKYKKYLYPKVISYMKSNGFTLHQKTKIFYSLWSLTFSYKNKWGNNEKIKIEINFINRAHIFPIQKCYISKKIYNKPYIFYSLNYTELIATKIAALLDRSKARDLYDVYKIINSNKAYDKEQLRKCIIFYMTVGSSSQFVTPTFDNINAIT